MFVAKSVAMAVMAMNLGGRHGLVVISGIPSPSPLLFGEQSGGWGLQKMNSGGWIDCTDNMMPALGVGDHREISAMPVFLMPARETFCPPAHT